VGCFPSRRFEKKSGGAPSDHTFEMVHWSGLLYAQPVHGDANFNFDPLYNNEPYYQAAPSELIEYRSGWRDTVRSTAEDIAGNVMDFTHHWFGTDALSKLLIDKVLRDLSFYYDSNQKIADRQVNPLIAQKVLMAELESALLETRENFSGELVLIAHSMESIIAYDVLRKIGRDNPEFRVEHFITIGSPLGLPTVKANIFDVNDDRADEDKVRTPTVVKKSWINYADRRDPVALDNHLVNDFGPNNNGVQVVDDIVLNDYRVPIIVDGNPVRPTEDAKANHHKSYGYLRTPELSKHLGDIIQNAP
jgi:hypothetical protein